MTQAAEDWDAIVVGGGVAGLVAARELALAGLHTVVLEAWVTPGGVVGRHEVDGMTLDAGAESFATRGGVVADLAGEVGLTGKVVSPEPYGAWVRLPRGSGPLPRTGLLGIPAHPFAADVRRTIGWTGSLRAAMDRLLPTRHGLRPEGEVITLAELVRARMGRRVLERLVRPVVAGVHAADPEAIAADAVAPGLVAAVRKEGALGPAVRAMRANAPAGSAVNSFDGGLHTLVDALAADLVERGGEVRCGAAVTEVHRAQGAARFRVEADGRTLTAPRLVVATPRATELLTTVAPELAGLHTDPGADIVLATLVLDAPELDAHPRGTGVLVAKGVAEVRAKALTHATAKWSWLARAAGPGRHVVRLSYGRAGEGAPDVPADLDGLTDLALHDASAILGVPLDRSRLRASARVTWRQGLPVPSAAHRETVRRVREVVAEVPGLAVVGAWVAGNGLASVVPDARRAGADLAGSDPAAASTRRPG
ncbi:protoporphyrinogen/coproporphyrinogen oxidase [Cellulomonas denverensis]|uniref:NAD(P)-binding protein n=1 Tax=Cellulomonas denverensis TaxID=264297 RepID=A0A7X6KYL3_9CELL|nr:FAD-dependent oxidoreductase [Cellulomonas denverensis]NKY24582.1 NAD(P)-binding protein [Cellulomonas denverensis]